MRGINKVFLLGYLGAEPEMKTSKSGKSYVRLSLATHYNRYPENGESQTETIWHRVTAWGRNAENCQSYLRKGSLLAVEGYISKFQLQQDDGQSTNVVSVVARDLHFISTPKSRIGGDHSSDFHPAVGDKHTPLPKVPTALQSDSEAREGLPF